MPETFQDNQISAGHNNTGGLVNVEALQDSAGRYFNPVKDLLNFSLGQMTLRGDGRTVPTGQQSFKWQSNLLWLEQWNYLYVTLLSSNVSGLVTVRTRRFVAATYANYNATLYIGDPTAQAYEQGYISNFVWEFTRVTAL